MNLKKVQSLFPPRLQGRIQIDKKYFALWGITAAVFIYMNISDRRQYNAIKDQRHPITKTETRPERESIHDQIDITTYSKIHVLTEDARSRLVNSGDGYVMPNFGGSGVYLVKPEDNTLKFYHKDNGGKKKLSFKVKSKGQKIHIYQNEKKLFSIKQTGSKYRLYDSNNKLQYRIKYKKGAVRVYKGSDTSYIKNFSISDPFVLTLYLAPKISENMSEVTLLNAALIKHRSFLFKE